MIVNIQSYLNRLNYTGTLSPDAGTLRALHRAHMFSIPFENLDIHIGRPIVLDEDAFFFTRKRICSMATPNGRVTVSDMKLIITQNGNRDERMLGDDGEYALVLKQYFGVEIV